MSDDSEREVIESVGLFEAAVRATPVALELPTVRVIAVALDGSNQDETARALARALAQRFGAEVRERSKLSSAAEILRFRADSAADLIVIPVPFGRDIGQLKDESLGSVVDMLLVESPAPVLCVRQVMTEPDVAAALRAIVLPLCTHPAPYGLAAGWAMRLAAGGDLSVLAIVDQDMFDEARRLIGAAASPEAWTEEALARAFAGELGGLMAALQRGGRSAQTAVHVRVSLGRPAEVVLEEANAQPTLIVSAHVRDHQAAADHLAADLILGARGPVLVV